MAESEDLDESSDLSETERECHSYWFLNMLMRTIYY
jgi:hypothetical protein